MSVWGSTSLQTSLTRSAAYQSAPVAMQRQLCILWSIHLFCLRGGSAGAKPPRGTTRGAEEERGASEWREIPILPRYLSDTAHGRMRFAPPPPGRHNTREGTEGREKASAGRGATVGHLKHGYLESVGVRRGSLVLKQQLMGSPRCVAGGVCRKRSRDWTNRGCFFFFF